MNKLISICYCYFFSGALLLAQGKESNQNFSLNGTINGVESGMVYLSRFDFGHDRLFKDSAVVKNGRFHFEGMVSQPSEFRISLARDASSDATNNTASVFVEAAAMNITLQKDHFDQAVISGSDTQRELDELNKKKSAILNALNPLNKEYNRTNLEYIAALRRSKNEDTLQYYKEIAVTAKDAMDPYVEQLNAIDMTFIKSHPASYVTASMMRWKVGSMTADEVSSIYNKMPAAVKQSSYGKYLMKELVKLESGSPGAKSYQFAATDINGNELSLAAFRGRYVLLDFWASWCVPCRKGNPHLKELYNKYKSKGFEIIGISDDDSKPEAWKKAVEKDGIAIWRHVLRGVKRTSGGYDFSGDISEHYGIHTLPTKILIDPKGIIVGRYGGGGEDDEAMDKKLEEIFR